MFWAVMFSKNKSIEVEIIQDSWHWFNLHIEITRKTDHAGFNFVVCLFTLEFSFKFYDNRHWNYEKDRWQVAGDLEKETK